MGPTFVDVQGFAGPNDMFIVKEIAVLKNEFDLQHFIFKPPYTWSILSKDHQRLAIESKLNHGFSWNDGNLPYSELPYLVRPHLENSPSVLVTTKSVKLILKRLFNVNAAYLADEIVSNIWQPRCDSHLGDCAIENVFRISDRCRVGK